MTSSNKTPLQSNIKPFVKWAGGKTRILNILEQKLPNIFEQTNGITYVEPFVGGGAMLFHMLQYHKRAIKRVIINDINEDLIGSYKAVQSNPRQLITSLQQLQIKYLNETDMKQRELYYYKIRELFNNTELCDPNRIPLFLFLNRTCFNGLYRVNDKGKFNVPHGRYKTPSFCTEKMIMNASSLLQNVEILSGNFQDTFKALSPNENVFFYFDPPYRPISKEVSNFTKYDRTGFGDKDQESLKRLCDKIDKNGWKFMVSNSDSKTDNGSYFDTLYDKYTIHRFEVVRLINMYNSKNSRPTEILITNY
jgi:DNA adenine methylase